MSLRFHAIALTLVLCLVSILHADNKVLGELQFEGTTNVERNAGV